VRQLLLCYRPAAHIEDGPHQWASGKSASLLLEKAQALMDRLGKGAVKPPDRVKRLPDVLRTVRALAVIGCEHPQFKVMWDGTVFTGAQVLDLIDGALKE
jgi:hypothetical protein